MVNHILAAPGPAEKPDFLGICLIYKKLTYEEMMKTEEWKTKKSRPLEERFPKYILDKLRKEYEKGKSKNETFESWLIRTKRI